MPFPEPGRVRNEVHVRATWECAACPGSAVRSYMLQITGDGPLILDPPPGWSVIQGFAYCGRHNIEVKVTHNNLIEMPAREAGPG